MATKRSFRDPVTNVLKCWGYIDANQPGDLVREESPDFALDTITRRWQWDGFEWVDVTPARKPSADVIAQATTLVVLDEINALRAAASRPPLTPQEFELAVQAKISAPAESVSVRPAGLMAKLKSALIG